MTLSLIHLHLVLANCFVSQKVTADEDLHPAREDRRASQSSTDRTIGDHEHLRLLRVFRQVSFLDSDSNENDAAEEDRKAADDAVAIGLGKKLNSHSNLMRVRRVARTRFSMSNTNKRIYLHRRCRQRRVLGGWHGVYRRPDDTIARLSGGSTRIHAVIGGLPLKMMLNEK